MEKRLLLAIVLMIAVILVTNLLFPPVPPPREAPRTDTVAVSDTPAPPDPEVGTETGTDTPAAAEAEVLPERTAAEAVPVPDEPAADAQEAPPPGLAPAPEAGDTVVVRSPMWEYRFSTRGATLVDAVLRSYRSYAPGDPEEALVRLVRAGDRLLGYRVAGLGTDTLDLRGRSFEADRDTLTLAAGQTDSLVFRHRFDVPGRQLAFRVTYRFRADSYLVDVSGGFEGIGGRGYTVLTSLGAGLRTNEANPEEDLDQLAYVVREVDGDISSRKLSDVEPEERTAVEGGPFSWVAVKNKYFLAALIAGEGGQPFGGLLVSGDPEDQAAHMAASLPVPAGASGFGFESFLGPQDFARLSAIGQDLENVNPYGWQWLRPIIRPLVGLIMAVLTWLHETFDLAYGWVLILFGVMMRVVLFPLYQKSMRAQMAQMQVQPLIKDLQAKYKDEPQKMQQEMMRLYREHNINPLAGCLPMLLPFPVLITLFFVFQNTIEFRGVPFMWLPDLSLKDPLYIIPLLMGASMFLVQWIGQRGMESNTQMKLMGYGMPIVFTFLFMNFPSGLNLYYATSNFASLPQQFYLSKERRKARVARKRVEEEREEENGEA